MAMVSPLWFACSGGDVNTVHGLLKEGSSNIDIEVRGELSFDLTSLCHCLQCIITTVCPDLINYADHAGVTPLIEAIKNGHVEVVRLLLDFGNDAPYFVFTFSHPLDSRCRSR